MNPTGIRLGYLVEVQMGFCAVPISKGQYRFIAKLRSICVLNREVDSVCDVHARYAPSTHICEHQDINKACLNRLKLQATADVNPLKRRVGYAQFDEDDEDLEPQSKHHKVAVSTTDVDNPMQGLNLSVAEGSHA